MSLMKDALGVFIIGCIIAGGWFIYPYITGHAYVGTVSEVKTISLLGYQLNVIMLEGHSDTYVVAPAGITKGEYVIVSGYDRYIPMVGTIVIGSPNQMTFTASVTPYSTMPFLIGLIVMGLGGLVFIAAFVTTCVRTGVAITVETASFLPSVLVKASAARSRETCEGRIVCKLCLFICLGYIRLWTGESAWDTLVRWHFVPLWDGAHIEKATSRIVVAIHIRAVSYGLLFLRLACP